jgi:flavin reductase (DIM6/NTAB) family NADH-FMN oxidoreductase RutF
MDRWNLLERDMNKFQVAGLTPIPAVAVKPPGKAECLTHIEDLIIDTLETGDLRNGRRGHVGTASRPWGDQP